MNQDLYLEKVLGKAGFPKKNIQRVMSSGNKKIKKIYFKEAKKILRANLCFGGWTACIGTERITKRDWAIRRRWAWRCAQNDHFNAAIAKKGLNIRGLDVRLEHLLNWN